VGLIGFAVAVVVLGVLLSLVGAWRAQRND
jgi:hypothetical protein